MRTRLLVGTVLLTAATIAAFFVPAAIALADAQREAQVVELQRETSDAAARLADKRDADDAPAAMPSEDDLGIDRGEHRFGLYDDDGRLIVGEGPADADGPVRAALAGRSTSARVGDSRVAAMPLAGGGAVRGAEPAAEADARTRRAILRLLGAAVLAVTGGCAAAWLLARRLSRPLGLLRETAVRLGGGDFTATAPRTGVAEVDDVAAALDTSASRIGAMVEREQRITADTSHQLRTPLAGLRLAIEAELASPRPDATEVLVEALGAVERMEGTVTALTDLARDERPSSEVPLDAIATSAVTRWRTPYETVGRAIHVDASSDGIVAARAAALDTILDVLLDNALHHGTGDVTIATAVTGGSAILSVGDQGACPMSDEEMFARRRSGHGSTGIGLHLARSLADAEGARLRLVRTEPTTFQLVLPAAGAAGSRATLA